jgi:acyl-CoA thioesterase-1
MIIYSKFRLCLYLLLTFWISSSSTLFSQMNEGESVKDAAVPQNSAMAKIDDVAGLPRVLLIGDSISIAYTLNVRELLKGKANVHRAPINTQSTKTVLTGTNGPKAWTADGKWDVIHFNCGLWDAKINWQTGLPTISREDYVKNLREIATRLKATGAKVIFSTTTPIPESLTTKPVPGALEKKVRLFDSIPERNALAVAALKDEGVTIVDLYTVILPYQEKLQNHNDVHYNPEGSRILAKAIADAILSQLPRTAP